MPNKHNKHKREDWISIVITIAFIFGFLLIANETSITGFTAVGENITETIFRIQDTTTLTVATTTQGATACDNLPTAGELNSNNDGFEGQCDSGELFYVTWSDIAGCQDSDALTSVILNAKVRVENGFDANAYEHYLSFSTSENTDVYCVQTATPATTTDFSIITLDCALDTLNTVGEINSMYGHFDNEDGAPKDWFQIDHANVTVIHDCTAPDTTPPTVTIKTPINTTTTTSSDVDFIFEAVDADSDVDDCILWLEKTGTWELNYTEKTITESINQSINITVEDSSIRWLVECNDTSTNQDNRGNSTIYNITIDSNPPTVTLVSPPNNTNSSVDSVNFTYQTSDSFKNVDNCSLWLYQSGAWDSNSTDTSIEESTNQTFNITLEDSSVKWRVECIDSSNLKANSTTYNLTVDTSLPTVTLVSPTNNTNSSVNSVNFTYQVIDGYVDIDSCLLWLYQSGSWSSNLSDNNLEKGINQSINITIEDSSIKWRVQCNKTNNIKANSTTYNLTIDTTAPTVTVGNEPDNYYNTSKRFFNFTYQVEDTGTNVENCSLWLYQSGSWGLNSSDTKIEEGINQTFNITIEDSSINWTIVCYDYINQRGNSTEYNLTVDTQAPVVALRTPTNNSRLPNQYVNFTYNVTDNFVVENCSLFIEKADTWELNATDTSIEESTNQTFNITTFEADSFNWTIGCRDTLNNQSNATTYNLTTYISNQPPTIPPDNITTITAPTNIDPSKNISFKFTACDPQGSSTITGAWANFTGENSLLHENLTCTKDSWTNTTCVMFNCTINLYPWFKAGDYNFSVNATDGTATAYGKGSTWTLGTTTALVISPTSINWSGNLALNAFNQTPNTDPIIINNTGNDNITASNINVTAFDLIGESVTTEYIPAANFTIDIDTSDDSCSGGDCAECNGTAMVNNTSTNIAGSFLARGNYTLANNQTGQETLYVCLTHVPPVAMISQQSYSTSNAQSWIVGITK